MIDWAEVGVCLLGTWPSQVGAWGDEGLSAYLGELEARGVTPTQALIALRSSSDVNFAPSAVKLAQTVRRDPSTPVNVEITRELWGPGGLMHARATGSVFPGPDGRRGADDQARLDAATQRGPLITAFVEGVGIDALKNHDPADPEWGEANRKWLASQWDQFRERADQRGVQELLAGQNLNGLGELRRRGQRALGEGSR